MKKKTGNLLASLIALIAWTTMGGLIGFATGYVVYVKQTAIFQSSGTLNITSLDADSKPVNASQQNPSTDLSSVITSQAVLTKAVNDGNLGRLFGITGKDAEEIAQNIQTDGSLRATKGPTSDVGTTYQIEFRGLTPSSAQKALHAICDAAATLLSEGGDTDQWQEAIQLLTEVRAEIEQRIDRLEQQRKQIFPEVTSVKLNGSKISELAVQYENLQRQVTELDSLRSGVSEKLRHVETLIQEGGSIDAVLTSLNLPVTRVPTQRMERSPPAKEDKPNDAEQQIAIAKRNQAEQQIRIKMKPFLIELDKLRERYGEKHPKVVFKKSEIEVFQRQIDALGPVPSMSTTGVDPDNSDQVDNSTQRPNQESLKAIESNDNSNIEDPEAGPPSNGEKVASALRALRAEKKQLDSEYAELKESLEELASRISKEDLNMIEYQRLTDALATQHQLLQQTVSRLTKLPQHSPFNGRVVSVINQPTPGVQVSPILRPILQTSVGAGLLAGLGLFVLVLVASLMTSDLPSEETE